MKLTTTTQVSVDGVMQGSGGASDKDRRSGFERGGWAIGAGDNQTRAFISQTYQRAGAFLFGRRTYEIFVGYWGVWEDQENPHRRCLEYAAQVRRIEHAHRTAVGGHDRLVR